jgi:hypothetical protein
MACAGSYMVRIELTIDLRYDVGIPGGDFVFNIHGAHTRSQTIHSENLNISQAVQPQVFTDPATHNRYLRLSALPGPLQVTYHAVVDLHHHFAQPHDVAEIPVSRLPPEVLSYIYPSRYCQSDRLGTLAMAEFGELRQSRTGCGATSSSSRTRPIRTPLPLTRSPIVWACAATLPT